MSPTSDRDSYIELLDEVMSWLTGLGLITFVIFPLALPLIALTALLAIPLLLAAIPLAILAAPMLFVRHLWRPATVRTPATARRPKAGENPPAETVGRSRSPRPGSRRRAGAK